MKLNYSEKLIFQEDFLEDEEFSNYMKKKKEVTLATVKKKFAIEVIEKAVKKKAVSIEKKLISNSSLPKNIPRFITFTPSECCSTIALKDVSSDVRLFL